jgi:tetratricopeptide (TPR) repeat protein
MRFLPSLWIGFLLIFLSPMLYGGGRLDSDLSMADTLIEEKQYDQAILVLTEYIKNNPDKFGQGQKRLQRIIQLRDEYNVVAEELLDVLVSEPDNTEKILALSRILQDMEPARNELTQEFLNRVRDLAQFTANRNYLEQILADGRALIDRGEYVAAINRYAGGLNLYRDEFFNAGDGEMVESRVNSSITAISEDVHNFGTISGSVNTILGNLEQIIRQEGNDRESLTQFQADYEQFMPALDQLILLNNELVDTGSYFDNQLAALQETLQVVGDRSFLSFASRLIHGRADQPVQEGMIGAVEGFWNTAVPRFEAALLNLANLAFRNAYVSTANRNYETARTQFETVAEYINLSRNMINIWSRFEESEDPSVQVFFDEPIPANKAEDYLRYTSMDQAVQSLLEAGTLGEELVRLSSANFNSLESWRNGGLSLGAAVEQEDAVRSSFRTLRLRGNALLAQIDQDRAVLLGYQNSIGPVRESLMSYTDNARSVVDSLTAGILSQEHGSAVRQYTIANEDMGDRLSRRQSEYNEGNRLIIGEPRGGGMAKYPTEALPILNGLTQGISADIQAGRALISQYEEEEPIILTFDQVRGLFASAQSMVSQLENLRTQGIALAGTAQTQAAQAEAFRLDGDRLYLEAQNALAQGNFEAARDRALRSGERYDSSLAIQESASLREIRDTRLVNLGAEITRLENEAVVREVRGLVSNAQDTYFAGNFERAEDFLVRAMNRWRRTNVEDDAEITYWLTVVRGAMSLRSGRTIPVTAPLYAEMSQLLSDAKKNYDEGIRLINGNQRREGLTKFNEARQKTQEVRLMFPVNQEAGILELRMDQVTDPTAFNASFQRRFNEAIAGTRRGSVESFADLQNLAEINPQYPGIRNAVTQAEIDMGYRPPPPDPRALARSNELTSAARVIVDGNVRAQFPIALEQLNEALVLNPSNTLAITLKDRVQTELGGGSSVVLSSAAEAEYQRAVRELQQGNTFVALAIVQQLLQDPRNRNSTRLVELQRRIESVQ